MPKTSKNGGFVSKLAENFTSQPILQQELKECKLRASPTCMSVVLFLIGTIYLIFLSTFGLKSYFAHTLTYRYDDKCENKTTCLIAFNITDNFYPPIGLYYKLTNFKQMHRDIASSYQRNMLRGKTADERILSSNSKDSIAKASSIFPSSLQTCLPRLYRNETVSTSNLYIPCGLLPSYVFNDTFSILDSTFTSEKNSITLEVDRNELFLPSNERYQNSIHWLKDSGLFPEGQTDPHFISWMRNSMFSPFRKLYAVSDKPLQPGIYHILIRNNYPTSLFKGQKYFIISEIQYYGTNNLGSFSIFLLTVVFCYLGSAIIGIIAIRRTTPDSPFNPINLKNLYLHN